MSGFFLTVHGAGRTVTGSCFELEHGGRRLLVDCGLFQGSRSLEHLNHEPFGFDPVSIDAVVVTHAHIDHSGLLPRIVAEGFEGPIWCTPPTADLLEVMLPDAAKIQEMETERRNRRADRADEPPVMPLYTSADAERALALLRRCDFGTAFEPVAGIRGQFWNAGHILGSASLELEARTVRLLFSGDLGPRHKSFHPEPVGPHGIDHLICESTYGDRKRVATTADQRRESLRVEASEALARGGNLVVPAFALERTQELLLDFATLIGDGRLQPAQIFIDSPLASRVTGVFRKHQASLEDLDGSKAFDHFGFHFVETVEQSMRLNRTSGAIILAASGMCEAGRIRHHLLHNLPRRDSTILFVGFQAQGTLGRAILEGARRVRISGRDVAVRSTIRRIDSYSAHADQADLVEWVKARRPIRGSLFLVHGEPPALEMLRDRLGDVAGSILLPEIGERFELAGGKAASRVGAGRAELRDAVGRDWQNDYGDFVSSLKSELRAIESQERRREVLARMRELLSQARRDSVVNHRRFGRSAAGEALPDRDRPGRKAG